MRFPEAYARVYDRASATLMQMRASNAKTERRASLVGPMDSDSPQSSKRSGRRDLRRMSGGVADILKQEGAVDRRKSSIFKQLEEDASPSMEAQEGHIDRRTKGRPLGVHAPCATIDPNRSSLRELLAGGGGNSDSGSGGARKAHHSPPPSPPWPGAGMASEHRARDSDQESADDSGSAQQPIWSILRSNLSRAVDRAKSEHMVDQSTKRLPIFHTTELASLPPPTLASLYAGQAMSSIHSEVLPLLHELTKYVGQIAAAQERGEYSAGSPTTKARPAKRNGGGSHILPDDAQDYNA